MAQKRFPINREEHHFDAFELLCFDICGQMEHVLLGGSKFLLLIVEEASGYMKGFCLRAKSETEDRTMKYKLRLSSDCIGNPQYAPSIRTRTDAESRRRVLVARSM